MKPKNFAIPLQKPSSGQFHNVSNDYKAIREGYDRLGGNPFGIKPELKPMRPCNNLGCSASFDPNTNLWTSGCSGACQYG